ncbi:hypothetical protein ACU6RU_02230 [Microbacterium sp. F1-18]
MAAIAAELEANALLISETSNRNEKRSTYEYKGATLTVVSELAAPDPTSPGVAPRFGIDTRFLPRLIIVDLSRADQQALASGGLGALNVALCAIPGIGWVSCGFITGAIQSAGEYIKNNGLCQNTFYITFDLQSNPKPWVSYRCS